ncbi:hypothetical protein TIFTF001_037003 [Ficus carica]|uniref:Uncharacterized protein n=1 Tax=Ficus carica TaxID=3494 RepID=A0AA88E5D5_FICCA|nr:hypothetical protein TIFTF001_037003 [Ficus carica]
MHKLQVKGKIVRSLEHPQTMLPSMRGHMLGARVWHYLLVGHRTPGSKEDALGFMVIWLWWQGWLRDQRHACWPLWSCWLACHQRYYPCSQCYFSYL